MGIPSTAPGRNHSLNFRGSVGKLDASRPHCHHVLAARTSRDFVEDGRTRWVVTSAAGVMGNDGRVGASEVMAAVEQVGTPVSSVDGLYDLQGTADALWAL